MALWLVRHGETEWSISGQHTGSTNISLTPEGQWQAVAIGKLLAGRRFDHVFASPMLRARETGRLAGPATGSGCTRGCWSMTPASSRA
jgi:probable phosphoglycerate mutase